MSFGRLRISITGNLVLLLTFACLISNFVVVMFYQKSMVRFEFERIQTVLDYTINRINIQENQSNEEFSDILNQLCQNISRHCIGTVLYNGTDLTNHKFSELQEELMDISRKSVLSQEERHKFVGITWGVFSLGNKYLLISYPLSTSMRHPGSFVLVLELDSIYGAIRDDQKAIFSLLFANILILALLGMFRMSNLVIRPLEQIIRVSQSYSGDDTIYFNGHKKHCEFSRLSLTLNRMLTRIEGDKNKLRQTINSLEEANQKLVKAHREVMSAEKLASVGRLSAGLAHEIGNPIGIIHGYIELLRENSLGLEERQQFGQRAMAELERINGLVRQLLNYAGTSSKAFEQIDINVDFVNTVIDLVNLQNKRDNVVMETKLEPGLAVVGNRESLQQVLLNCMLNALDAVFECGQNHSGKILLIAERKEHYGDPEVEITIIDNGIGIEKEDIDSLFDPFYTTKEPGKGTGLGLFVSHSIIEAHGGTMAVQNNQTEGVTVTIILPLVLSEIGNG